MLQQLILEKDWTSNYRGIAIWMGLNIIDAASTYIALQGGGIELNPILGSTIGQLQLISALIVKALLAPLTGIFALRWNPGLIFWMNIFMACVASVTTMSAILTLI